MKHFVHPLLLTMLLLLSGCIKVQINAEDKTYTEEIMLRVCQHTKLKGDIPLENEKAISDLRIYIFNMETNKIEAILGGPYNSSSPHYSTKLVYGYKRIITLANMSKYPEESQITKPNDLTDKYLLNMEKLISSGHFPLLDDSTIEFTPYHKDFTITLKNAMARICIRKINNSITKGHDIKLINTYLSNIPGTTSIDHTKPHTSSIWYNKYGKTSTTPSKPIESEQQSDIGRYGFISILTNLINGDSYIPTELLKMYTFPNNTPSGMITRLVITTEISGNKNYYPIDLTTLEPGYSYDITLTVTKPGSDDPDTHNFLASHDLSITMTDWGNNQSYSNDVDF